MTDTLNDDQPEPLLTAREVATWLAVSPNTILDWAEQGRLPSLKLGRAVRFRRHAIHAWLAEAERAA